jgi:3-oxoacyl-[acyl-carrier-protein] synthase-3
MHTVFINKVTKFLPYEVIDNENMEERLGLINGQPSKVRRLILRNNGIQSRYYAFAPDQPTLSNAHMTANAVAQLLNDNTTIDLLACGTTSPDQTLPGHASMVHGLLGGNKLEAVSFSGACNTGMSALKYAMMAIKTGDAQKAASTGSERMSLYMTADKFKEEADKLKELEDNGYIAFEKDFLRWMLSDGAGAALLSNRANESGISLKIEWIESTSFANELETCMYAGAIKNEHGQIIGYNEVPVSQWTEKSVFAVKQDTKLLGEHIVTKGTIFLKELIAKHQLDVNKIDWFLPHLSSNFFKTKIKESIEAHKIDIPYEKWFMNLTKVGNVGAASVYLMLEELLNSDKCQELKDGQKILIMVPESARFSYSYALMTVIKK